MAARSKAWVCDRSLPMIVDLNPPLGHGGWSVVSVVCCQVEVSASGRSLVQRSPTECGVSECDHISSTVRRPLGLSRHGGKKVPQSIEHQMQDGELEGTGHDLPQIIAEYFLT
jgi:hypothetical protein